MISQFCRQSCSWIDSVCDCIAGALLPVVFRIRHPLPSLHTPTLSSRLCVPPIDSAMEHAILSPDSHPE